ncbi:hypothetical protein NM688_g180 [Phlebia brevispora]|uniref:Uncharacterized protein n=1 Tax=Phlebia brevispora TaxID=194682 RepID=A0ACC1TF34_9APHY|nr:hypothetical protein NM688_g180 [Phlebia brevispora]
MATSSGNQHNGALTVDQLRTELLQKYEEDPRLEPFIKILNAVEAPEIDYASSEVDIIIQDLKKLNSELIPEKPQKKLIIHPLLWVCSCRIVRWAARQRDKPRVRVAGFRHSWSDIFGQDGDVVIMFLPYDTLVKIPYHSPDPSWRSELTGRNTIHLVNSVAGQAPPAGHAFCKVMAGVTNDQFREWSFENKTVCIPFNVIMVEITLGGSNAPVCHGAGFSSSTLSDLVKEITYVDAMVDMMGVTEMSPIKLPLPLTIPPPTGYKVPWQVKAMMVLNCIGEKELEKARQDFIDRCEKDYYLEWFWFPYQTDCWVNTWSKRPPNSHDVNLKAYPQEDGLNGVKSQQVQATLAEEITSCPLFEDLKGHMQAYVLSLGSMLALPDIKDSKDAIKTYVSEALHFRRGIQNFRCLDTEWEIPITTVNGARNYEQIQRAWWDAISLIYSRDDAPVRVALEMRLTGGSDVLLAPQRGNSTAGTASIEILTTLITPPASWASVMQQAADIWATPELKDEHGKTLYPRLHWAKQWTGLKVRGKAIKTYLKEDAYKEAFAEFRTTFEQIVTKRGSSVEQTLAMFGNPMMIDLIFN